MDSGNKEIVQAAQYYSHPIKGSTQATFFEPQDVELSNIVKTRCSHCGKRFKTDIITLYSLNDIIDAYNDIGNNNIAAISLCPKCGSRIVILIDEQQENINSYHHTQKLGRFPFTLKHEPYKMKIDSQKRKKTILSLEAGNTRNYQFQKYLPPGFRNNKPIRWLLAAYGYLLLARFCSALTVSDSVAAVTFGSRLSLFLCIFVFILYNGDYLDIWDKIPFSSEKSLFKHFLLIFAADIFLAIVLFFLWLFIYILLNIVF